MLFIEDEEDVETQSSGDEEELDSSACLYPSYHYFGCPFTTRTFLNTIDVNLIIELSEEAFKLKVKHMELTSKGSALGHALFGGRENLTFSNIPR